MRPNLPITIAAFATLALPTLSHAQTKTPALPPLVNIAGLDPKGNIAGFQTYFEVSAFSFGASNPASIASGKISPSKPNFSELSFQRSSDLISTELLTALATSRVFATVTIKLGGDITITLSDVRITSYQLSNPQENKPMEQLSLAFGKIRFDKEVTEKNGTKGKTVSMTWDIINVRA